MPQAPKIHNYTHLPDGSDPLNFAPGPVALRAAFTTGMTVSDNNETEILWDIWENEDATVFGETTQAGPTLQKVSFLAQGVYSINVTPTWDTNFNSARGINILDDSGATGAANYQGNMGAYGPGFDASSFTYPVTFCSVVKWPRLGVAIGDVLGGVFGRILVKVIQRSGSDKDLTEAALDIFYLGPSLTSI